MRKKEEKKEGRKEGKTGMQEEQIRKKCVGKKESSYAKLDKSRKIRHFPSLSLS